MKERSSHRQIPNKSPHSYPQTEPNATPAFPSDHPSGHSLLSGKIRTLLSERGPIKFREFMEIALYDPAHGYYATDTQRVGMAGDFITSVSVGRCFGLLLARRLVEFWKECGQPNAFHIIEPGAHDGSLCADILHEARSISPGFYQAAHYHLIDASPALSRAQEEKLGPSLSGKFTTHASLSDLHGLHGALLSNELIDAFPVDLIRFEDGQWQQLLVGETQGSLHFIPVACEEPELRAFCQSLGTSFPDGYTTEYNPGITRFTQEASVALDTGLFITIDYGHHAADYYHPGRSTGTLQTYHRHQKSENPLERPGEIDITSHVDFTRLITAAESAGFGSPALSTQASYLTNHARPWLLSLEASPSAETPSLLRQFQTLTHPAMLGTKFMVLEMVKSVL